MADEQRFREHHFESFLKRMVICDGTNQADLESWLERADTAFEVIPTLTVEEAKRGLAKVSSGVLLETQHSYQGDVLGDLITHVRTGCVSQREDDRRILDVDTYRQGSFQPMCEYVANFRMKVGKAYTEQDMANAKLARQVIKTFVNGIYSERARCDTAAANPATIAAAYDAAIAADSRLAWVRTDSRTEEPMEIGACHPPPSPEMLAAAPATGPRGTVTTAGDMGQLISQAVAKQLAGMQRQLTDLRKSITAQPSQRRTSTSECFYCGRVGHMKRDCRKLRFDRQHTGMPKNE